MNASITSNRRPLARALYAFFIAIAALGATPPNARAKVYVTQFSIVSEYDATTGGVIKASFIMGLNLPVALAVSGNTLLVASAFDTVSEYDAKTGDAINGTFIT